MSNSKKIFTTNTTETNERASGATARDHEFEADVLFQRIYDKWYAFSVVEDDCLITEVSEVEVQKRLAKKALKTAA
ncbi:MAG: hypothetical protein AB1540_04435 [Bdellovibrionota bacterium]